MCVLGAIATTPNCKKKKKKRPPRNQLFNRLSAFFTKVHYILIILE